MIAGLESALSKDIVGTKAYNLSVLIKNGFSVPNGFVVYDFNKNDTYISNELKELLKDSDTNFFAVRSSANVEDSQEYSFAGIFDSYLNVDKEQLFEYILKCSSVLKSNRLKHYAESKNIDSKNIKLSIIIQKMIKPILSGVAFSHDPINNDNNVIYIEAVNDIGEKLVQGESNPSIKVWFDKKTKSILRCDFSNKQSIPENIINQLIIELSTQVIQIEKLFNSAQDIEWAIDDKYKLWFLQTRPITSISSNKMIVPTYILPGKPYDGWSAQEVKTFNYWDEYNSIAVFPLEWDLYEKYLFHINLKMLSFNKNILNIMCFYKSVPVCLDPRGRVFSNKLLNYSILPISDWNETLNNWEIQKQYYSKKINHSNLDIKRTFELLIEISSYYAKMRSERMLSMFWIDKIETLKKKIVDFLKKYFSKNEIEDIYDGITQYIQHETNLMYSSIYELQLNFFKTKLLDEPKLQTFFERYGHIRYDNSSLSENKDVFISKLLAIKEEPKNNLLLGKVKYEKTMGKIKSLNPDKDIIDAIEQIRYWINIRETSKTKQDLLFPLINKLINKVAKELKLTYDNIKLLTLSELKDIISDKGKFSDEILDREKIINWKKDNSWLPDSFFSTKYDKNSVIIKGEGCSFGEIEKPIKILRSIEDFSKITNREIAVVYKTDPSWTPLFSKISGIIVEKGSRLSHAAIVAREMNIPAIVGINNITKILSDDEIVFMNGQTGIIKRHDKKR